MKSALTAAHSSASNRFSTLVSYLRPLVSYLRPFGIVIELFYHIHSLFRLDRAIHCCILQPLLLEVHSYNFQHTCPLRDNNTGGREKEVSLVCTVTVWLLQCLTQDRGFRHSSQGELESSPCPVQKKIHLYM